MIDVGYYNGTEVSGDDLDAALRGVGLSQERIELIRMRAYQTVCCQALHECNCVRPIIDYGMPKVLYYEALMPALNDYKKLYPKRYVWKYCPFCGRSTERVIHPDNQVSIDETF